jgi:hypothetical protein
MVKYEIDDEVRIIGLQDTGWHNSIGIISRIWDGGDGFSVFLPDDSDLIYVTPDELILLKESVYEWLK